MSRTYGQYLDTRKIQSIFGDRGSPRWLDSESYIIVRIDPNGHYRKVYNLKHKVRGGQHCDCRKLWRGRLSDKERRNEIKKELKYELIGLDGYGSVMVST